MRTSSPAQTFEFGKDLGARLPPGAVVTLVGDLASGKTVLAKGLAVGLGVPDAESVTSPTYDLVHEYRGRVPVHHVDLYRLDEFSPEDRLWIEEYLFGDGVTVIEWADRLPEILPEDRIDIVFGIAGADRRVLRISGRGACREAVERLR